MLAQDGQTGVEHLERLVAATGLHERTNRVYLAMVQQPELGVSELAEQLGLSTAELRDDLDRMAGLSLIKSTPSPDTYLAVPPDQAVEVLIARAEERIAREREDIARTRESLPDLVEAFVQPRLTPGRVEELEYIAQPPTVRARIYQLAAETGRSASFMVPGEAFSEAHTQTSLRVDLDLLSRDVRLRTITSTASLSSPWWADYLIRVSRLGADVRVLDLPPLMQVIFDDEVAVVPVADSTGACVMRSRSLCGPSVALFEEAWGRATPLEEALEVAESGSGLDPKHRMVLTLLAQGMTDEGLARRMSCSTRTVGRIISEVMQDLRASSRFQAGVLAAQRGLVPGGRPPA